ncbi:unnamed protein product [Withania somnifera]
MAEEKHQPKMDVEDDDDEVFYERIEAPKFVDFSTPDHYRPDDRYWFCLRVGCDQKHEEEMDSEKIYKDFVLRVMAARSPNVRLQKTLSKHAAREDLSSIKANIHSKNQRKASCCQVSNNPKEQKCLPNPNSFRSVQNPKPAALVVPKNRTIKSLVFHSPKKAISLKKSVETPLTKLCQGIKKLEITDQKKHLLDYSGKSKDSKPNRRDPLRNRNSQKDKTKTPKNSGKSQTRVPREARPVHLTNIQSQAKLENQRHSNNMAENECRKAEVDLTLRDGYKDNYKDSTQPEANVCSALQSAKNLELASEAMMDELNSNADQTDEVGNDLPHCQLPSGEDHNSAVGNGTELKTITHSIHFQTSKGGGHHHSEGVDSDDKENVSVPDENRSLTNDINQSGQKVLGVKKMQKVIKKNAQPEAKNLKEGLLSSNGGASGMKPKKPKHTNPKPFRLRTNERGIHRVADLQRKKQGNVEYPENENKCTNDYPEGNEKDSKGLQNDISKETGITSVLPSEEKVRLRKSCITPEKSHATKPAHLQNAKSPLVSCLRQGQKLTVIQEASAEISKPNKEGNLHENGAAAMPRVKALTPSRTLSRGRRPLTIPKEPHFHGTHRPKSCTRNLVEQLPL